MEIIIDPEFKDYLGALDGESRQALEESLKLEGCRDGLVIWRQDDGTAILLDGHNRHELCTKNGIDFYTILCPETVVDRQTALAWIVENQRARRNLTPQKMKNLIGAVYELRKRQITNPSGVNQHREDGGQNDHHPPRKPENEAGGQIDQQPTRKTEASVAKEFGVSPRTVRRAAEYHRSLTNIAKEHGPEVKRDILDGAKRVSDFLPDAPTIAKTASGSKQPSPDAIGGELTIAQIRAMSDSECTRYIADHAVILPGQDCGAVDAPFPLPENISENMADPEVARRAHESLDFALCELRRHIAGAETAIKRQRPDAEACVKYRNRIDSLIDDLQDVSDLLN